MDIERETKKNDDGTITVTTRVTYRPIERERIKQIAELLMDLSGVTNAGGVETYDTTAVVAMTEFRKKAFADAASLLEKILYGD